ncbi:MAG: ASCH domain-containing protein [Planctomycetota bacterium]
MNRLKRTQFWGVDENDERLLNQVLAGHKTATACPACEYHIAEGDYEDGGYELGDLVEVYDLKERKRCTVRITEVYKTTFGDFPDKLWQGECNANAEEFRKDHIYCWPEYEINDDFEMMINHFELVEIFD